MTRAQKPRVIIFCDHLLYPSETFIQAQASALSEFEPVYAGSRRVQGLDLRDEQVHVIRSGNGRGKYSELTFKLFGYAPAFTKELQTVNAVLLHAHYGPNGLRALPLARNLNIPLIVTFHGFDITATNLRGEKSYLGFRHYLANKGKLKNSGALFLAVSNFIRGKLLEQGFPEERVLVHYTGVDTRKFRPATMEESPVILFVGRLEETKGPEFAIRAAAVVQREYPDAKLVLIGEGTQRADLEKLAKRSLRSYDFLGLRTPEEVCAWMNRASVICVPSITNRSGEEEGFGMVCAEAHAVGKPVVAFNSGGISETVSHGCTGFLAPERDWRAMAGYLITLLKNRELRRDCGSAARERAVRQFDLEHRTQVLEGIYRMAVQKGNALDVDADFSSYLQLNHAGEESTRTQHVV